jgi:hypothetical protein
LGGDELVRQIEIETALPDSFAGESLNGNPIHRFHHQDKLIYVVRGRTDRGLVTVLTHKQFVLREVEE